MISATLEMAGYWTLRFFEELGSVFIFLHSVARTFFSTRGNFGAILAQIALVSYRSIPTVLFAGIFVGAILVIQFNVMLRQYDAQSILGGLGTSAVIREVGPLIISFLLAGKIGAYTAAELGTMRVTEQIDAIECLGADPIQTLIVPRFLAIIISSVILLMIGLIISVGGAVLVADLLCGVNPLEYLESIPRFSNAYTLFCGAFKCLVYSLIVASVSCYKGFFATGGAQGVGRAVTATAVYTNFYIVIANYVVSHLLQGIGEFGRFFPGS